MYHHLTCISLVIKNTVHLMQTNLGDTTLKEILGDSSLRLACFIIIKYLFYIFCLFIVNDNEIVPVSVNLVTIGESAASPLSFSSLSSTATVKTLHLDLHFLLGQGNE